VSKCLGSIALAIALFAAAPAFSQVAFPFPAWLENFPGATPDLRSTDSLAESSYSVDAQPSEVIAHYRKLFEAQGLPFQANFDGMGWSIRAEAKECNLLIVIRQRPEGTFAKVDCVAKDAASAAAPAAGNIEIITGTTKAKDSGTAGSKATSDWAERVRQHNQEFPPAKFNKDHHDMPAPPLEWPDWLTHVRGAPLKPKSGMDPAKYAYMRAQYTTNVPMTEIFDFYRNLLKEHGYPPKASLATGHTFTGIQQNALGYVNGYNFPDGIPGAHTAIEISFDRTVLNGPITVTLRFSTHEYVDKRNH
jgi:hypothetical protein